MSAIDNVMVFWDVMSTDEKKELILRIGEKALNTVTFSPNPSAPHIQKGQFTFRFALK